jgi:hypothetical protein
MKKQKPEFGLFEVELHALPTCDFFVESELEVVVDELT